ncbi:argininosuccinate lyase [Calderihabitans maritimus]|uniref:Argininosuccinate lyase n=1 Tax=Calderihabitans maritimus TaxID=1246530 RepID=A0A1Z5HN84_9FIRM|nr:argininosuccinate lyase [Calderihabitans maritimus]GAW90847.1 argininosuccinate lyase [Calderihabitans maritimus]
MKLWGGRFTKETDKKVDEFHSSISFDQRLYRQDILGSMAHARMLGTCGIISQEEADKIIKGLEEVLQDIEEGKVEFDITAEDIHMNIERLLIAKIGDTGKKLHTARSRNDQVALDTRMYLKEEINNTVKLLKELQKVLVELAKEHLDTVMPGYTHLQKAQPVTLAHHLMAYFEMFQRDVERLLDCYRRTDVMPLGSGALAGTTFPIDRQQVARELGFAKISANSLDAVSDRDFVIEFTAAASLIMMHLSRFAEELVLWSSDEFSFVEMDDAYSTGSSIMPQKKNPDVAELVRGKTGRVYGNLVAMLTMMKSLPLAYNKDMQEDKEALFDTIDTVQGCLSVFIPMLKSMRVNRERMLESTRRGFTNATDVADYLVRKGLPFRDAHRVVGQMVLFCLSRGIYLEDLTLEEFRQFSAVIDQDIFEMLSVKSCVERRNVPGGPAREQVLETIKRAEKLIESDYGQ